MPGPLARTLLALPAALYGAAVRARNRRYDRPGAAAAAGIPVISVGNLTVGGTGKTPVVAWLAARLESAGRRPAIVSRGYRGSAGRGPLLVSAGDGPIVGWQVSGDEPNLLARMLPGVRVVVGSDRVAGALEARRQGARVVLLDDGFQHRRLARDLDIVLLDAGDPFGGGRLLPAGRLREPLDGLSRADAVIVTRSAPAAPHVELRRAVREANPGAPILTAGHRVLGFFTAAGAPVPPPSRAVVFCGLGNPLPFRDDVERQGVTVERFEAFRDHHAYDARELGRLRDTATAAAAALVTTEKDLTRIETAGVPDGAPLLVLRIEAEIHEPDRLWELVERALAREAA